MFEPQAVHFGITPTCWTNDDFPLVGDEISFEQCVSEIALAGYVGCSVGHKFPTDPVELKAALDLRGLRVSEPWHSTYFTVQGMEQQTVDGFKERIAFLKAMGATDIGLAELGRAVHQQPVALLANKPVLDDVAWKKMVNGLNTLGEMAHAQDMRLCYHHHMGSVVQSHDEVDRLMADTDPSFVHLLLDTGHLLWAGGDPLKAARDHADRICHVHLKDIRIDVMERAVEEGWSFLDGVRAGVFTVPGDGDIDFPPILQALADNGFAGWLVVEAEQDPAKAHPLTYAKKGREYLREVTGL
jgi:inosose dehydratase